VAFKTTYTAAEFGSFCRLSAVLVAFVCDIEEGDRKSKRGVAVESDEFCPVLVGHWAVEEEDKWLQEVSTLLILKCIGEFKKVWISS
jgi:hypothetical protein